MERITRIECVTALGVGPGVYFWRGGHYRYFNATHTQVRRLRDVCRCEGWRFRVFDLGSIAYGWVAEPTD